ncbi:acyl-CoA N-acyltransferase [Dichomitus squalens]|uniref:Acyl-CoA N-acyltransferase n=1 Tax=Dichomitus squalens TaxID=114155 RepID=A0A4Q9P2J4_9APHY|nr:acyl-CoA N-acyltransferase [Dichomitus squalens]TBU48539.1 acyl-CoA N-acyltransferase [Dichomitus squalens]TBU53650.1 acyl-CoA N-acyltransferase [Dichomitus squalens]
MILMTPIVREATQSDIEQLAPLFVHSLDTSVPGVKFSDDPYYALSAVRDILRARLFPPKARKTYVLESHTGELLAYATVKPDGRPNKDADEIDHFFVRAGESGKGYGGRLMEVIQDEFGERGLSLIVFQKNEGAKRFYEKWGFQVEEDWKETLNLGLSQGPIEEAVYYMRWSRTSLP